MTTPASMRFAFWSTRHERLKSDPRRARGYSRGTVSTLWLNTSGRASITRASGISWPRKSGVSTSTAQPGARRRIARIVAAKAPGAEVGQVVAVHRGHDAMAQSHLVHRVGHAQRLRAVDHLRHAGLHVAEAAPARAGVAQDHERGGAPLPALADVGAVRLLADGVQRLAAHQALDVAVGRARPAPSPSAMAACASGTAPRRHPWAAAAAGVRPRAGHVHAFGHAASAPARITLSWRTGSRV